MTPGQTLYVNVANNGTGGAGLEGGGHGGDLSFISFDPNSIRPSADGRSCRTTNFAVVAAGGGGGGGGGGYTTFGGTGGDGGRFGTNGRSGGSGTTASNQPGRGGGGGTQTAGGAGGPSSQGNAGAVGGFQFGGNSRGNSSPDDPYGSGGGGGGGYYGGGSGGAGTEAGGGGGGGGSSFTGASVVTEEFVGVARARTAPAAITLTPEAAATTTTLAATPNPVTVGSTVTLTATVSPPPVTPTTIGTVTFKVDGAQWGAAAAVSSTSGVAIAAPVTGLSVGTHTIEARYSGNGFFQPSSSTVQTITVAPLPTTTTTTTPPTTTTTTTPPTTTTTPPTPVVTTTKLVATPASPVLGGTLPTLTATVSPSHAVGTIEFYDGDGTLLGGPLPISGGEPVSIVVPIGPGTYIFKAAFTPTDPTAFTQSSSPLVTYVINPAP